MEYMRRYIKNLLTDYNFPESCEQPVLNTLTAIRRNPAAKQKFEQAYALFNRSEPALNAWRIAVDLMNSVASLIHRPAETVHLVFILYMSFVLRDNYYYVYRLPARCFDGVVEDIRAKVNECITVRGIVGTFVPDWYDGFFQYQRVAIGRLQFELKYTDRDIEYAGTLYPAATKCLGVHIPSGRALDIEQCKADMLAACDLFADKFPNGEVLFDCSSWLLSPELRSVLPADGTIARFAALFTLIASGKPMTGHLWRIFGTEDMSDPDALPHDTRLQQYLIQCLKSDTLPHNGYGFLRIRGKKFE